MPEIRQRHPFAVEALIGEGFRMGQPGKNLLYKPLKMNIPAGPGKALLRAELSR